MITNGTPNNKPLQRAVNDNGEQSDEDVMLVVAGDDEWTEVYPEDDDENSVNITGLTFGEKYEIQVVAKDGAGNEQPGDPVTVTLGTNPGQATSLCRCSLLMFVRPEFALS